MSEPFFEGFDLREAEAGGVSFRLRIGGTGPPLLLLHGHPRTHTTWWRLAPLLADRFTLVCPDLPGFGRSRIMDCDVEAGSTKRAKAAALVALMDDLGFSRFHLLGHDRGSYTAFRLAMDHPAAVARLVLVDCVPLVEAFERADARFAIAWWHWFFFAVAEKPERAILADPDGWYGGDATRMGERNHADFRAAIHDLDTVSTMVWDYRVSPSIDRAHDAADRAHGRRLACPTLCLWTSRDDMAELYGDVLAVWRPWAVDLTGGPIDSGHHVAEEAPEALAERVRAFLA